MSDDVRMVEPDEDIDLALKPDTMRVERMGEDAVWFAAYFDDDDELDRHFLAECGPDGITVKTYV